MKSKMTFFLLIILIGCNLKHKNRDFYSSYYYVLSGKHIYLGMTKEEIEAEMCGPLTDITDDYGAIIYEKIENISFEGTKYRVINTFIIKKKILSYHDYKILVNYQTAKSIVNKYKSIPDINLYQKKGILNYHTLSNNTNLSIGINYEAPYLNIIFHLE